VRGGGWLGWGKGPQLCRLGPRPRGAGLEAEFQGEGRGSPFFLISFPKHFSKIIFKSFLNHFES